MNEQEQLHFTRIAEAIDYLSAHFREQPALDEVARRVHLSPFHFQRLFTEWAGVSPKKFLQYLTLDYAKGLLQNDRLSLFDTAIETGLSGTGRLHDLFVNIEGMTPGEYKNGGEALTIRYRFADSPFGELLVAATEKGICHLAFVDNRAEALETLRGFFPNARMEASDSPLHEAALRVFSGAAPLETVRLHLKGTPFQLKVWEALLKIPAGGLSTYTSVAGGIGQPGALRAVGTAIGRNPVAYLIPCHRVIQSTGSFGQYRWGSPRKRAMIGWEAVRREALTVNR